MIIIHFRETVAELDATVISDAGTVDIGGGLCGRGELRGLWRSAIRDQLVRSDHRAFKSTEESRVEAGRSGIGLHVGGFSNGVRKQDGLRAIGDQCSAKERQSDEKIA